MPRLLQDEVLELLEHPSARCLHIRAGWGDGKSCALQRLREDLPADADVAIFDEPRRDRVRAACEAHRLVVYAADSSLLDSKELTCRLAPWTRDDHIEYLMLRHPQRCASVMKRLHPEDADLLRHPATCVLLLDRLAVNLEIPSARDALLHEVHEMLGAKGVLKAAASCTHLLLPQRRSKPLHKRFAGLEQPIPRLFHQRPVQVALAAHGIVSSLSRGNLMLLWQKPLPEDVLTATSRLLASEGKPMAIAQRYFAQKTSLAQACLASAILAADPSWVPPQGTVRNLTAAKLASAQWNGVDLGKATLNDTQLAAASLTDANLADSNGCRLDLRNATIQRADLRRARLRWCKATGLDARGIKAQACNLSNSDLSGADFSGADLRDADLTKTKLNAACLAYADLSYAQLWNSDVDNLDLRLANLTGAELDQLPLYKADLAGAILVGASLIRSNLEGVEIDEADFHKADLEGAQLTGSRFEFGNFAETNLTGTGLAHIHWRAADLRGADLRGASFHLGSSRSGLVDSTIASEGSRTGFYTDEYGERDFQDPDAIRKADLREADLRGANIAGVDFYLVDLRGAKLDPDARQQTQQTGAIF